MSVLDLFRLDGKTALVTGCKRGIGKAMAIALAEAGAEIVGVSKTLEASGSAVGAEVAQLGRKFHGYPCDFGSRKAVRAFLEKVKADFPVIDILVNNAGTILRKPAAEHPDEYWDEVIETNLSSQFVISREIGKADGRTWLRQDRFHPSSLLTFRRGITVLGYRRQQRQAIGQLTKVYWPTSGKPKGVQVNAIAPGYIRTDNTAAQQSDPVRNPAILSRIPAGRWGEPDDFKGAVVFLASRGPPIM